MDIEEGIHKSRLKGEQPEPELEPELAPVPTRKRSKYARWFQALAAVLLVACVAGGVFVYQRLRNGNVQTASQPVLIPCGSVG